MVHLIFNGYAFNWSPEGVVNEYLNDCEVIEGGVHKRISPMEWVEKLVILPCLWQDL